MNGAPVAPEEFFSVTFDWDDPATESRRTANWDFKQTKNGHLHCEECGTPVWCEHIEQAVKAHADSEAIWVDPRWERISNLQVPMFPTANLWTQVVLEVHEKTGAYKVLGLEDIPGQVGLTFLGFIHEGEGRLIIRSLILDWFIGVVEQGPIKCMSASHKPQQEFKWQEDIKDPATATVARWAVWTTGSCIGCLVPDDWSDLIPVDSGNRRSPFSG